MLKLMIFIISLKMTFAKYIIEMKSFLNIHNISYKVISDTHILVDEEHIDYFANHPHTKYIEENKVLNKHSICSESWGIDRINQRNLPLDYLYNFNTTDSSDIDIYVIDTGVDIHHSQFSHKKPTQLTSFGTNNPNDCDGHGTHVSGIIGGKNTGLSPYANIFSIKIEHDCSGTAYCSNMIQAVQLATDRMIITGKKSIINLSFGICYSVVQKLNTFMINGGIVSLASGNDGVDVSNTIEYTSFDTLRGFVVGSTDLDDKLSYYSNYGNPVHIYAPGSSILSADYNDDNNCVRFSGTSMAAPLVSAALAIYWNENNNANNNDVIYNFKLNASKNKIITDKTIHNNLLFLTYNYKSSDIPSYNDILFIIIFIFVIAVFFCIVCKKNSNINFNIPIRHRPNIINNLRMENNNNYIGEPSISLEGISNDINNPIGHEIEIQAQAINNVLAEGKSHSLELKNNQLVIEDQKCIDESTPVSFA